MEHTTEQETAPSREIMVETAVQIMVRLGYSGLSMAVLAAELGTRENTVRKVFSGRHELGRAALEYLLIRMQVEVWDPALDQDQPLQGVLNLMGLMLARHDRGACPAIRLTAEMRALHEDFDQRLDVAMETSHRRLIGALTKGQRAGDIAAGIDIKAIADFILAVCFSAAERPDREAMQNLITTLENLQAQRAA